MKIVKRENTDQNQEYPLRVLQFGGGNFLRAFVDWIFQQLNEQASFNGGVIVVKPTKKGDYLSLKSQEGLFHVVLDGIKEGGFSTEVSLVNVVQKIIHCYDEWGVFLETSKIPELRFIVSNTTEAGIRFNDQDNFSDAPPQEFPAKLTIWLYNRFTYFKGAAEKGCIFLPCELVEDNGKALRNTIVEYIEFWQLSEDFKKWILENNFFCSTLVDRIVSGYPSIRAEKIQTEIGFKDELLVAGEHYHSWVIQEEFELTKELPFHETNLNIELVKDLTPYREMKVRVLNGAHTAMVPIGYLMGLELVLDVMKDEDLSFFIEKLLLDEVAKTLEFSSKEISQFVNDVLNRFRNPVLRHQLISISLNSISKFSTRLLPTLKDYLKIEGQLPRRIVFSLSALLLFYKGNVNGQKIPLKDDASVLEFFKQAWKENTDEDNMLSAFVKKVLGKNELWGEDLNKVEGLAQMVEQNLSGMMGEGIKEYMKKL
ncbi:tagaturonate reductase [Croceitalea marina]|uniref:Tagaturonate reductase n=1 Tax=Croceitalea marina TaxID=1775166 RepID=A0ABW5MY97_9FLAO